jgi:hypothetical protein
MRFAAVSVVICVLKLPPPFVANTKVSWIETLACYATDRMVPEKSGGLASVDIETLVLVPPSTASELNPAMLVP